MSVAICNSSTVPFPREGFGSVLIPTWLPSANGNTAAAAAAAAENREIFEHEEINTTLPPLPPPPRQVDIWSSIQSQKKAELEETKDEPYVHPLVRHSSSLLSQKSLEVCTESLGSETGSDHYVSSEDEEILFSSSSSGPMNQQEHKQQVVDKQQVVVVDEDEEEEESDDDDDDVYVEVRKKELATVNYHCSIGRRSPPRSFPPPLPSISSRSGPCFQMRPHRKDGRLVVEAVAVPSQNYLHSERQGGRLVLSFIQTDSKSPKHTYGTNSTTTTTVEVEEEQQQQQPIEMEEEEEEEDQEEEEEVEVVDRGTVVEVKVSTQPQQQSGCGVAAKVHRSSIVINKFVSCTLPSSSSDGSTEDRHDHDHPITTTGPTKRATTSTTTAAAAAVAASSLSTFPADGTHRSFDNKLLFTSKRRNSEELLRDMRRCHQLRKPLFIWEPCCIATSS